MPEFQAFPKIYRLNREVVVTEKLDGTNACVVIEAGSVADPQDGWCAALEVDGVWLKIGAQSRGRVITPEDDNFGFAAWVRENAQVLSQLGIGYHYGEWWGLGIQRGYGLKERRFSLFNVTRWQYERPTCCHVVPVLARGVGFGIATEGLDWLRLHGSVASPGFMKPEGIVAFHAQGNILLKATLERDEEPKGKASPPAPPAPLR